MMLTICLLLIILSYYVVSWFWSVSGHKRNPRVPPVFPGSLPIVGHAHLFIGDTKHLWNFLKETALKSLETGGITTLSVGSWIIYVLSDPEDCTVIGNTCLHKDVVYDLAKPWLGEGLVTASVHTWKRHRKLINPAFSQHVLDGYITVFNSQSRCLVDSLAAELGKGPFDHMPYLEQTTLEIICLTAMGIDDDSVLHNGPYMSAVSEIFHIYVKRVQDLWLKSDALFYWSAVKRRHDRLVEVLHGMSNMIIQKRKSEFLYKKMAAANDSDQIPKRFISFLDRLLELSADGSLSDLEIREEVDTMVSAGFDTSATLLTIAMVVVGSYPEVQERIYEEVTNVLEGSDRDIDKQDLPKLVYLEAVLKECIRLYPVVPLIARRLDRDVELKNYTLPAGSSCFFPLFGVHHHPAWGPDASRFIPERWFRDDVPVHAFAGFGLGRRTCIGQKFALMASKTTLAHLIRSYRVTSNLETIVFKMDIMLKPHSGHYVSIEKR